MKRWERWGLNASCFVITATGIVYLWMKYFVRNDDPFAVVNHPWQAAMLHAHLLAAPVFILMSGIVLNSHVLKKLGATRLPNRKSGLVTFGTFAVMIASGYLLQVVSNDVWLRASIALHIASSLVFAGTYAVHLLISVRLARKGRLTAIREVA
jgi:hypothetical protein